MNVHTLYIYIYTVYVYIYSQLTIIYPIIVPLYRERERPYYKSTDQKLISCYLLYRHFVQNSNPKFRNFIKP